MRILHVIDKMDPQLGGVCHAVRMYIRGLLSNGVHNEVVSLDEPYCEFIKHEPYVLHCLGTGKGLWKKNNKLIPWLVKNLSSFDAVIVHGLWLYHSYAVRKALKICHEQYAIPKNELTRFYIMPHGMLDPYFQRAAGRRLKAVRNWVYWKLVEEKAVNYADSVFFTCRSELLLAREPFTPYHPKKEVVVGLGIESPPLYTQQMQQAFLEKCPEMKQQPYLLFLSRIHEKKGLRILLKAYGQFVIDKSADKASLPKLLIAGPGFETAYGKEILELINESEALKPSVVCTGMLTGKAKWGAFYGADAFVLPSHQENFGIAVVEALACGKPVLISDQINIYREIESAGAGLVSNDTEAGVKAVLSKWFSYSHEERKELGQKAYNCFASNFEVGKTANKLLQSISR